jgi:hypothetical protein
VIPGVAHLSKRGSAKAAPFFSDATIAGKAQRGNADHADSEDALKVFPSVSRSLASPILPPWKNFQEHPQNPRDPRFPLFLPVGSILEHASS